MNIRCCALPRSTWTSTRKPNRLAQQLLGGSEEDETAWRNGEWYAARLCPSPLSHDERRTAIVDHERDNMRLQIRTPGDLQTMEFAACDRVPPGPGQIEVAVTMSTINFADVLIAFGRFRTSTTANRSWVSISWVW